MPKSQTIRAQHQETRYLVLDDRIIAEVVAAKLTLGEVTKHPQNPLLSEDKPWEPRFDNVYANVIYDSEDKRYKCWYNPFIIDERLTHTPPEKRHPDFGNYMDAKPNHREMGLCYAFSTDGIHWKKPELGLIEFDGDKQNNIISKPIRGTATDAQVEWETSQNLAGLNGNQIRLKFQFHNAKLYAFQFWTESE